FVSVLMLIIFHLYFLYYFSFKFEKGKRLGRSYRERMIFFTFDMPRNLKIAQAFILFFFGVSFFVYAFREWCQ
ncbi:MULTISPECIES: hypothetical protein, partial [Alphaproteobacteria]|uniref:hypothetical protein n=1 Tax=Alphaproteobacteria TaxID=28211 RepID=UPI003262EBE5